VQLAKGVKLVTVCHVVVGLAAFGDKQPPLVPANPKSGYRLVLTTDRRWVCKREFDKAWGKRAGPGQRYFHL
jgi:hypothetical protein